VIEPLPFVSIHAPVMGATHVAECFNEDVAVSIHAPVMGATKAVITAPSNYKVSIHAPVMGATSTTYRIGASLAVFQSTRP